MDLIVVVDNRPYKLDELPADLLREEVSYRMLLTLDEPAPNPDEYLAIVGGLPLPAPRRGRSVNQLEWEWHPDFFSGEFGVEIRKNDRAVYPTQGGAKSLHVSTDMRKLTANRYQAMLDDLTHWTTGWLAPGPGLRPGGVSSNPADSLLAQLDYLARHWARIRHLIEMVLARPRRRLERVDSSVPLHAIRTTAAEDWPRLLQDMHSWERFDGHVPAGLRHLHQQSGGLLPVRVTQSKVRSTLAVPENAFVSRFLHDILALLERALELLEHAKGSLVGGPLVLVEQRQSQALGIMKQVRGWLRSTWLAEIEPEEGPIAPTVALMKHPVYAALWRFYLQWRRAVTLTDGGGELFSLARTHELYELWCFLTVARLVAEVLCVDPDQAIVPTLSGSGSSLRLALEPHKTFHLDLAGRTVRVSYQRNFGYHPAGTRVHSFSHKMIPDITIQWNAPDGTSHLLVLDPKYRVHHNRLVEALDDIHQYRDALVSPDGSRAVTAAFLLCPAPPVTNEDHRYMLEEYQEQWHFGICVLEPGTGPAELRKMLVRYLGEVAVG